MQTEVSNRRTPDVALAVVIVGIGTYVSQRMNRENKMKKLINVN